ncbi:MAG: preprotein translocase subunit SecG [Flavobacteriales bacterium]|nr:preprotein translocase subunit SecG [Flavobacteriales bacterium]NQX98552.1 preprotein translocase subunit SecG [Flavobacteriales bacterium]
MFALITVLVIIVCILLILIVLVQNPKGGLDSAFSTNNQVMGVRKTTDFLEKATWTMGIALVVLSIASSAYTSSSSSVTTDEDGGAQSKMIEEIDEQAMPSAPAASSIPLPANNAPAAASQPVTEDEEETD